MSGGGYESGNYEDEEKLQGVLKMLRYKKEFTCTKCGKKFTETVPDCLTPQWQEFLRKPVCRRHRGIFNKSMRINKSK